MKAVVYRAYGPPDVLRLADLPTPVPGPGEVLVRVRATSATAAEAAARSAHPAYARLAFGLVRPKHPVLGAGVAGDIAAAGPGVTGFAEGDPVVAECGSGMGGYAEYVRVPAAATVAKPEGVSYADAVAVTEGGLTALHFLRDLAEVRRGQDVLIVGAAGAIGVASVQLAAHFGAAVTGVCGTDSVGLVRDLGATRVVDRSRDDFTTARDAYDVVFDTVARSSYSRCRHALRRGGRYLTTAPDPRALVQALWTKPFGKGRAILGFAGVRTAEQKGADLAILLGLAAEGVLRPVVGRRFTLAETAEAHRYVDTGHKRGVALITVGGD